MTQKVSAFRGIYSFEVSLLIYEENTLMYCCDSKNLNFSQTRLRISKRTFLRSGNYGFEILAQMFLLTRIYVALL
jgi:hypothetical protein